MSARPTAPNDGDPFVRVTVDGDAYAVWFHAGRPAWVASIWPCDTTGVVQHIDDCHPERVFAQAARQAEAFLAQFRLPAVAS